MYIRDKQHDVRIVALFFSRPDSPFAREQIFPALPYFHDRSGEATNAYFAGFSQRRDQPDGGTSLPSPDGGAPWWFSAKDFNRLRASLEQRTRWRYSGGADLIIGNVVLAAESAQAEIDFSSVISTDLIRLHADEAFQELSQWLETIFRWADAHAGSDPTWGLSDHLGIRSGRQGVKELLISFVPESVRGSIHEGWHYTVADLSGAV